jgi:hypothetical protein
LFNFLPSVWETRYRKNQEINFSWFARFPCENGHLFWRIDRDEFPEIHPIGLNIV